MKHEVNTERRQPAYQSKEPTISREHRMKMIIKARAKGVADDVLKKLIEYWDCKTASKSQDNYLLIRMSRYKEIMETLEETQSIPSILRDLEYRKQNITDEDFY